MTQHCVAWLEPAHVKRVVKAFADADVLPLLSRPGWFISPWIETNARRKIVTLDNMEKPPGSWQHEIWSLNDKRYSFLNVGYRQFESESNRMNALVWDHFVKNPQAELELRIGLKRSIQEKRLRSMRWGVHKEVGSVYVKEKTYLTNRDMSNFVLVNQYTSNYDVLVLLEDEGHFGWERSFSEHAPKDLVDTIQITYIGYRHYFQPSLRGLMRSAGIGFDETSDKFPFVSRLMGQEGHNFYNQFTHDFDPSTTFELTRTVNFRRRATPIRKRFVWEALRLAKSRGMRVGIAATDDRTAPYFEREYGFTYYRQMPTGSGTNEYLISIDLDEPATAAKLRSLELAASSVHVENVADGR